MQSTLIVSSYKTSKNQHPFIVDPKKWVGTPWDSSRGPRPVKGNAELIAELHSRLENQQNVSDLFSENHRSNNLSTSGKKPVFNRAKHKLSTTSAPTPSNQQLASDAQEVNPFSEIVRARGLPLEIILPIAWTLPYGFSVKHLDGSHYLPLFAHGMRETKEFLSVSMGDVALQAFRDVVLVQGPCGRVFRQLRITLAALRIGIVAAASSKMPIEDAFLVGSRILTSLKLLVTCDGENENLKGANAAGMFYGSHPPFNAVAAPLVSFRVRVVSSKEYARKDPRYTDMANQIFSTLSLIEELGGGPATKFIASAFPSGYAC